MITRRNEVEQALRQEGVRREAWFMGHDTEGLFLIGVMDTDDKAKSLAVSQTSKLEVNRAHREFKKYWSRNAELAAKGGNAFKHPECVLLWDMST